MASSDPIPPLDPESETFQDRFFKRLGPLGLPFVLNGIANASERSEEAKYVGHHFDPRPDVPVEDERGQTLDQLRLKAAYLRSKGAYPPTPFDPDAPAPPINPMARQLGAASVPWKKGRLIPESEKSLVPGTFPLPRPRPKSGEGEG
jgi:hypothetical protein